MSPDTCPICGVMVSDTYDLICAEGLPRKHKCKESTLKQIDNIHKRDGDNIQGHTLRERLKDGFKMIGEGKGND